MITNFIFSPKSGYVNTEYTFTALNDAKIEIFKDNIKLQSINLKSK